MPAIEPVVRPLPSPSPGFAFAEFASLPSAASALPPILGFTRLVVVVSTSSSSTVDAATLVVVRLTATREVVVDAMVEDSIVVDPRVVEPLMDKIAVELPLMRDEEATEDTELAELEAEAALEVEIVSAPPGTCNEAANERPHH